MDKSGKTNLQILNRNVSGPVLNQELPSPLKRGPQLTLEEMARTLKYLWNKSGNAPKDDNELILKTYKRIAAGEVLDAFDFPLGKPLQKIFKTIVNQLNEAETLEECVEAWHTSNPAAYTCKEAYILYKKQPEGKMWSNIQHDEGASNKSTTPNMRDSPWEKILTTSGEYQQQLHSPVIESVMNDNQESNSYCNFKYVYWDGNFSIIPKTVSPRILQPNV